MSRASLRLLASASLAALSGCASDSTGAGEVLVVAQVEIQPPGAGLIIGGTQQFSATPRTASGIPVPNRQTTWSSSDPGIATVSGTGLVTAVDLGEVEITARVDGASGSRSVNVSPKPVAQVTVQPPRAEILVGQSTQLQVTTLDSEGQPLTGRTVLYSSDNPAVATVSADGLVTGVGPGQTAVRANSEGKEGTSSITVTARPATKLGFTTQPANGTAGLALGAVVVAVQDVTGGTVVGATGAVTIALSDNPGNATLSGTLTVNAVAGLATFSNLVLNRVASGYTLQATAGSLTPATSAGFAIAPGAPAALAISSQPPTNTQSGAPLNPQPVLQLRDAGGNAVPQAGLAVTAALLGTGGALNGALTVATNAAGSAVFSNLSITGPAGIYQIRFTGSNLTSTTSSNIAIVAAALAISTQPSTTAQSGAALPQQPAVRLVDALGAPVAQPGVVITASLTGAGAALGGTLSATTNGSGVATFTGLTITGAVGAYHLGFASPGMTPVESGSITLTAGAAAKLALAVAPPKSALAGAAMAPQPAVQIQDASGNPVALAGRTVTAVLATTPGSGASLSNATATSGANGVATFSGLTISGPLGEYTLRFQSTGLEAVVSDVIAVTAGAPTSITFATQPPNSVQNGQPWNVSPRARVRDKDGNAVPGVAVTVALRTGPSAAVLGGTLSQTTASDGIATFPALTLTGPIDDYRIGFNIGTLASSNSSSIELQEGPPAKLGITTAPSATAANDRPFPVQPVIQVQDVGGNPVDFDGIVTASIASGGGTLGGNTSDETSGSGRAVFSGLKITGTVGPRTLRFSSGALTPVTSGTINLVAGIVTRIVLVTQPPSTIVANQVVVPNPVVDLEDMSGNDVDSAGVVISVSQASGSGSLQGTLNRSTAGNGRATYNDLRFSGAPGTRSLGFNRSGLQGAVSANVEVTPAPAQLVVTTQPPAAARSSVPLSSTPTVQVRDAGGISVAGVTVNAALVETGSLSGTVTGVSDGSGNVTFTGLTISGPVGVKTLRFSTPVSGVPAVNANPVTLAAGPATQLAMVTQPGTTATNGVDLSPQPSVRLEDSQGNPVDSANASVSAVLSQGNGTLNGTKTVLTNASGLANFGGLDITGTAPGPFAIRFEANGITSITSAAITLVSGQAGSLTIGTQPPASLASGASFAPTAIVRDGGGNPVSGVEVTVSIASGGGTLSGSVTRTTTADGVATFSGLALNATAGPGHVLRFDAGALNELSNTFTVTIGAPTTITITVQPSASSNSGAAFNQQPEVELRDSGGNLVSGVNVTAILVPQGFASGSLNGTNPVATVNGLAAFPNLSITRTSILSNTYRIRFSAAGLDVTSNNIAVN